jgi:hypothetical protein
MTKSAQFATQPTLWNRSMVASHCYPMHLTRAIVPEVTGTASMHSLCMDGSTQCEAVTPDILLQISCTCPNTNLLSRGAVYKRFVASEILSTRCAWSKVNFIFGCTEASNPYTNISLKNHDLNP